MRYRKNSLPRLSPDEARRQGHITQLALKLLGRESAIAFLNGDNSRLGGRPLDLAMASEDGCAGVEEELGRLTAGSASVS